MDTEGGASVGGVHQTQVRREGQLLLGGMSGDGREPAPAKAGVAWLELEGNSNAAASVAFLKQLKEKHPGPLKVIWDNAPAHRGEATGNLCLGRRAVVQDRVGRFPAGLSHRKAEVRRRCRTVLQSRAEAFRLGSQPNAHPTVALV